jgi:hypothetical protein
MDPMTGVVKQVESVVRFGLTMYTSNNGGPTCPVLTKVPIALNNYAAIGAVYDGAAPTPEGDTPTGESITASAADLVAFAEPGPKFILLVTDGLPDTCAVPDPQTREAQISTVAAARNAKDNDGIGLFIVGVSADISPQHLQEMANVGAGRPATATGPDAAPFWVAGSSQADLAAQLSGIIGSVRTCVFHLAGTVSLDAAGAGIVRLDGQALGFNDPNGWKLNGPSDLEIVGTACEKIKTDGKSVAISFPCDAFTPIN